MAPKPVAGARWLATDPSKRWAEVFFLSYSPFWIIWALCLLVPLQLYEYCNELGYLVIGLVTALPLVILPLLLDRKADKGKPFLSQFWVKANIWIAIFSYVGNYFWTHYFYRLLGASYTFKAHRLNDVPIALYMMTHAYFCFYHGLSNILLRRVRTGMRDSPALQRRAAMAVVVFLLSYSTAFMETLTIAHFPYYTFVDKERMYTLGSLFYAIYFFASFPIFFLMDEEPAPAPKHTAWGAARDSLAAAMLVTIALDLWRICLGSIHSGGAGGAASEGLPWML